MGIMGEKGSGVYGDHSLCPGGPELLDSQGHGRHRFISAWEPSVTKVVGEKFQKIKLDGDSTHPGSVGSLSCGVQLGSGAPAQLPPASWAHKAAGRMTRASDFGSWGIGLKTLGGNGDQAKDTAWFKPFKYLGIWYIPFKYLNISFKYFIIPFKYLASWSPFVVLPQALLYNIKGGPGGHYDYYDDYYYSYFIYQAEKV